MTLTDTMYIGTSGLLAHSDALGVVGDNIANTSTIGYKRDRAEFSDMLGGQMGGFGTQLGGGVKIGEVQTLFDQGSIQQTGNPLDMALQGNGFFVVHGTHNGVTGDSYTRDGQFQLDTGGFVVDRNGMRLQGFPIDGAGARGGAIGDLQLGARQNPPVASTSSAMQLHLDDTAPVNGAAFDPNDPVNTSNFQTSETIYDSLGNAHHVDVYMRNDGAGKWEAHAVVDGGDLQGGTKGTPTEIGTGTLQFDANGQITSQSGSIAATFAGAAPSAVSMDFTGTMQTAGASSVTSTNVDGRTGGTLTDIKVSSDGKITGVFDNGQEQVLAQVGVATFTNETGLQRQGDGLFGATIASGQGTVDVAGQGGRAGVMQGALESSNVDLSTELVTMISYQRAFEANSKIVTTADEMMQEVSNLKR